MESVLSEFEDGPSQDPVEGLSLITNTDHVTLTPQDKVTLVNLYHSKSYGVLLKLMEGEVTKAETDHFRSWRDREKFVHTGLAAVGMRIFFERIQTEINRQVEEFAGEVEFAKQKKAELSTSLEEQVERSFR